MAAALARLVGRCRPSRGSLGEAARAEGERPLHGSTDDAGLRAGSTWTAPAVRVLFLSQIVPYPPHGGVLQRGYNLLRELGRDAQRPPAGVRSSRRAADAGGGGREPARARAVLRDRRVLPALGQGVAAAPARARSRQSAVSSKPFSVIAHRSPAFQRRVTEACLGGGAFDLVHVDTIALSQFVAGRFDDAVGAHAPQHRVDADGASRRGRDAAPGAGASCERESAQASRLRSERPAPRYDVNIVISERRRSGADGLGAGAPDGSRAERRRHRLLHARPSGGDAGAHLHRRHEHVRESRRGHALPDRHLAARSVPGCPASRFFAVGQDPPAELQGDRRRATRR